MNTKKWMDYFLGDPEKLRTRYRALYDDENPQNYIDAYQSQVKRWSFLFLGMFLIIVVLSFVTSGTGINLSSVPGEEATTRIYLGENWEESIRLDIEMVLEEERKWTSIELKPWIQDIKLQQSEEKDSMEKQFLDAERELRLWVKNVSSEETPSYLELPTKSSGGVEYHWRTDSDKSRFYIFILPLGFFLFLYLKKDEDLRKKEKEALESVESHLPQFVTRLVLLLEAGLVVSAALERIIDEYRRTITVVRKKDYFIDRMIKLDHRVRETKGDYTIEIKQFSHRTGSQDFIRIGGLINENRQIGSELSEKLLMEANSLWERRKRSALEKGRVAESKLTFPLMFQIISLITIITAPVFIAM